jgi:hypothetical protein
MSKSLYMLLLIMVNFWWIVRHLLGTCLLLVLLTGCMSATYRNGDVTVTVHSFGRKVDLTKLMVDHKTAKTYTGIGAATYSGTGDTDTIRAITEAAVEGAVKGATRP